MRHLIIESATKIRKGVLPKEAIAYTAVGRVKVEDAKHESDIKKGEKFYLMEFRKKFYLLDVEGNDIYKFQIDEKTHKRLSKKHTSLAPPKVTSKPLPVKYSKPKYRFIKPEVREAMQFVQDNHHVGVIDVIQREDHVHIIIMGSAKGSAVTLTHVSKGKWSAGSYDGDGVEYSSPTSLAVAFAQAKARSLPRWQGPTPKSKKVVEDSYDNRVKTLIARFKKARMDAVPDREQTGLIAQIIHMPKNREVGYRIAQMKDTTTFKIYASYKNRGIVGKFMGKGSFDAVVNTIRKDGATQTVADQNAKKIGSKKGIVAKSLNIVGTKSKAEIEITQTDPKTNFEVGFFLWETPTGWILKHSRGSLEIGTAKSLPSILALMRKTWKSRLDQHKVNLEKGYVLPIEKPKTAAKPSPDDLLKYLKDNVHYESDTANVNSFIVSGNRNRIDVDAETRGYPEDAARALRSKLSSSKLRQLIEEGGWKETNFSSGEGDDSDYPGDHAAASVTYKRKGT